MGLPRRNLFREKEDISPEEADALMHYLYPKFVGLISLECWALKRSLVEDVYSGTGPKMRAS